jgi:type II secretory pathway pseudopilin PulG
MRLSSPARGFKLIEMMFTTALIGVLGLVMYSLLNISTVLGAKNTAVNTAHQQARTAMIQMFQDLHSSVSLPYLIDVNGNAVAGAGPAAGIAFQQWATREGGPHKIIMDAPFGDTHVHIAVTAGSGYTANQSKPKVNQRLIIPTHQIEADITAVSGTTSDYQVTLGNIYGPATSPPVTYPVNTLPIAINGTTSSVGDVVCFVTDRCSYTVANNTLIWNWNGSRVMGNDITNATPFSIPTTPAGSLYYRFVAAIDLSTSDLQYSNRGYKAANILLNGQVPFKARLTTYQ